MPNERLRATLLDSDYDERSLADALSLGQHRFSTGPGNDGK
jgi:hypothetical protein